MAKNEQKSAFLGQIFGILLPDSGDIQPVLSDIKGVQPGEILLGTLRDKSLRILYGKIEHTRVELADEYLKLAKESAGKPELLVALFQERGASMYFLKQKVDAFSALLQVGLSDIFPEARDPRVAWQIRKNWQVVVYKIAEIGDLESCFRFAKSILEHD